ncbi:carbon starvation CstA family protein, partial [Escherichia coli]
GPLVGPVLAAQMGYLPGTLWLRLPERTFTTGRVNRWITLRASRS